MSINVEYLITTEPPLLSPTISGFAYLTVRSPDVNVTLLIVRTDNRSTSINGKELTSSPVHPPLLYVWWIIILLNDTLDRSSFNQGSTEFGTNLGMTRTTEEPVAVTVRTFRKRDCGDVL
jgi:hypothetical protein